MSMGWRLCTHRFGCSIIEYDGCKLYTMKGGDSYTGLVDIRLKQWNFYADCQAMVSLTFRANGPVLQIDLRPKT